MRRQSPFTAEQDSNIYKPPVDYDIIRAVRESVSVPVIANGDIDSAERAKEVMDITGCDLVMIGRATLGNPWIFSQINAYLENPNVKIHTPDLEERLGVMIEHIGKWLNTRASIWQCFRQENL